MYIYISLLQSVQPCRRSVYSKQNDLCSRLTLFSSFWCQKVCVGWMYRLAYGRCGYSKVLISPFLRAIFYRLSTKVPISVRSLPNAWSVISMAG